VERVAGVPGRRFFGAAACARSSLLAALAVALCCPACSGDGGGDAPERLVDESVPPALPAPLDVDGALMTAALLLPGDSSEVDACLARFSDVREPAQIVERVGAVGRSITFRHPSAPRLYACDASAGAREPRGEWCDAAVGRLRGAHLTDARLSLANCVDDEGKTVASAWLEPLPGARWLAVEQEGYTEIYETAGNLPVRIATNRGIGDDNSSVRVQIAQYGADGAKLDEGEYELRVAG
jgi:hypothetical protein